MGMLSNYGLKEYKRKNTPNLFGGVIFPLVTRLSAQLFAYDLIPVQPIDPPEGRIFYQNHDFILTLHDTENNKFRIFGIKPMSNHWIQKRKYEIT